MRDAIAAFRAKGKFAIAFADRFGEFGAGTRPYYLATAFGQIWLQPMGDARSHRALHRDARFSRARSTSSGSPPISTTAANTRPPMNVLTEDRMTPPQREEIEGLLHSISGQVVNDIAAARKLPPEAIMAPIDEAPLLPGEALEAKLVDRLGYRDEAIAAADRRAGSDAEMVNCRAISTAPAGHTDRASGSRSLTATD